MSSVQTAETRAGEMSFVDTADALANAFVAYVSCYGVEDFARRVAEGSDDQLLILHVPSTTMLGRGLLAILNGSAGQGPVDLLLELRRLGAPLVLHTRGKGRARVFDLYCDLGRAGAAL
jgi:hypothetical protein